MTVGAGKGQLHAPARLSPVQMLILIILVVAAGPAADGVSIEARAASHLTGSFAAKPKLALLQRGGLSPCWKERSSQRVLA